jgi:hypothetical protein
MRGESRTIVTERRRDRRERVPVAARDTSRNDDEDRAAGAARITAREDLDERGSLTRRERSFERPRADSVTDDRQRQTHRSAWCPAQRAQQGGLTAAQEGGLSAQDLTSTVE